MNSISRNKRWVLLEHFNDPLCLKGNHFDLLLEGIHGCHSWRLEAIPVLNGPWITATPTAIHKLSWLDKKESEVSGGRGWAKRIKAGHFQGSAETREGRFLEIELVEGDMNGVLEIKERVCRLKSQH